MQKNMRKPSDSFKLSLLIMNATGFFPLDNRRCGRVGRLTHLLYSAVVVSVFILGLATQLIYSKMNWRDVGSIVSVVPMLAVQMVWILKIYVFWKKNARIMELFDMMDRKSWVRAHLAPQSLIFTIPVGTALLVAIPVFNAFIWILFPLLGASEYFKFPFKFWMPDYFAQTLGYYTTLSFETLVIFGNILAGTADTVTNTTICGLMAHVRAQLTILGENLHSIGRGTVDKAMSHPRNYCEFVAEDSKKQSNLQSRSHKMTDDSGYKIVVPETDRKIRNILSSLRQYYKHTMDLFVLGGTGDRGEGHNDILRRVHYEELHREFVKCMQHHQTILNFAKELESIFTWAMFAQFIVSATIICSATVQTTMVHTMSIEFYFSFVFAGGMCTELAIFCFFGNYITDESSLLPEAIYSCDWLSTDVTFRRQMLIFMETTKTPITISAGKFFQLSKQTFLNILKSSYSYYAVFKGLRVNGKLKQ